MFAAVREWLAIHLPPFHLPTFGLTDAIDIFIVTCILYLILRWIKKTRAWPVFKGIVIVLLVALFASFFNLVTVLWMVQNAIAWGLLVVVILFQPELRRALEQIGRGGLIFSFGSKGEGEKNERWSPYTVNEIVKAAKAMSNAHTGALIVLEQRVDLSEQEKTGISIDAAVSSQLLLNIFEKNTPLHDGAVIIRHNRVAAATCILPITSEILSHNLGTRHRAAVGVSEISDALVIVVSEETGTISVVMGGQLERELNEYQLRDLLMKNENISQPRFALFRNRKGHEIDDIRR